MFLSGFANMTFILFYMITCSLTAVIQAKLPYDVHTLSGPTVINRDNPTSKSIPDIYCYSGTPKSLLALWQTAQFNIKIKNNEFSQYIRDTPQEVYKEYTEDSYGWSSVVYPFKKLPYKTVSLGLFNTTCMAINTKHPHAVELQIIRIDKWRLLTMLAGLFLISFSRQLSGNPVFFYICGILIGVSASFMVVVYYLSKLLPRKPLMYSVWIGGWTMGMLIFQQLWSNLTSVMSSYKVHLMWYCMIAAFVSFVICYRIGPPRDRKSQNIVMWTIQIAATLMIYFSSEYQEASSAITLVALTCKYFPQTMLYKIKCYWFPPKRCFLSNEEYYEEGARETKMALENLRKYCSSPDCAQWRIMMKLNDSKRFASFVEGDSHLSDEEVLDYESYAYELDHTGRKTHNTRSRKSNLNVSSTNSAHGSVNNLEISDDDESLDSDDDL